MEYRVISADGHIVEPPHIWETYLPQSLRQYAPKLVKDADGGDAWQYSPELPPAPIGLVVVKRGRKPGDPDYKWTGMKMSEAMQGAFYGDARVKEQDEDGIDAEVIYAPVRTLVYFTGAGNPDLAIGGVQAYNNWLAKDFCAAAPDRLIGLGMIPNTGLPDAITELRRCREIGLKGMQIMAWPSANDSITEADDPFWAEAVRLKMPVSIHVRLLGAAGMDLVKAASRGGTPAKQLGSMSDMFSAITPVIAETIFSGVFDRFPALQFVAGEVNVGWVPDLLENMDDHYERDRKWMGVLDLKKNPSEYWKSNWAGTFIQDHYGIANRHNLGVNTILWSNDYPHHRADFGRTREIIEEHMRGVPDDERRAMLAGNAARIYGLNAG